MAVALAILVVLRLVHKGTDEFFELKADESSWCPGGTVGLYNDRRYL